MYFSIFFFQIQYLFCDKTGTLTENKMLFKRCTIGGHDFAHKPILSTTKEVSMASLNHESLATTPGGSGGSGGRTIEVNRALSEQLLDLQMVTEDKQTKVKIHPEAGVTLDFFVNLAICNTVIVGKPHK